MAQPLEQFEGKYKILSKIGEGGMGTVYKVRHVLLDEVRVIKVMRQQDNDEEGTQDRFLREARIAVKLRHRNIAQMYDFAIDDSGTAYIVMEYVDGITLQTMLKQTGTPDLGLTLEIAQQSLKALSHLHKKGIIHRDISPDNLMLACNDLDEPRIKLIDLGIAKTVAGNLNLTATGVFLGKIRYASPEQFRAQADVPLDHRSDLYSFGVVLYELLSGVHPIKGDSFSSLIAGHLFEPPMEFGLSDPQNLIPDELRKVVLKSLAKSADDRFQDALSFRSHLTSLQGEHRWSSDQLIRSLAPATVGRLERVPHPGTTQNKIDRQFAGMDATPPPLDVVGPDTSDIKATEMRAASDPQARADALVKAADNLVDLELWQEARLQLESALKVHPGNTDAIQIMEKIEAAETRAREVAEAVSAIEGLVQAGKLEPAVQRLEAALSRFDRDAQLTEVEEKVHLLQRERLEAELRKLWDAAEAASGRGEHRIAVEILGKAYALDRTHTETTERLDAARAEVAREEDKARLATIFDSARAEVESQLTDHLFDEARARIRTAITDLGEIDELRRLSARVDDAEMAWRESEVAELVQRGEDHFARENLREAINSFEEGLRVLPGHAAAGSGLARARQRLDEMRAQEAHRQKVVSSALARAEDLLRVDRFDEAEVVIGSAVEEVGMIDALGEAENRVESARTARLEREVEVLFKRGTALLEAGDFHDAVTAFEECLCRLPAMEEASSSLSRARQLLKETEEREAREAAIAKAVDEIDRSLAQGKLDRAGKLIAKARNALGDDARFGVLSDKLEKAVAATVLAKQVGELIRSAKRSIKKNDFPAALKTLEQAAVLDADHGVVQTLLGDTRRSLQQAEEKDERERLEREAKEKRDLIELREKTRVISTVPFVDPPTTAIEGPAKVDEPAIPPAVAAVPDAARAVDVVAPAESPRPATEVDTASTPAVTQTHRGASKIPKAALATSILVVVAIAAVMAVLSLRTSDERTPTSGVAVGNQGTLVVSPVPWAVVTKIIDGEGNPVDLPSGTDTPLNFALSPGVYTVMLTGPGSDYPAAHAIEVSPGETTRLAPRLSEIEPEAFLTRYGL